MMAFETVCDTIIGLYQGVERGNMMRSPALKYQGKVFCFLYDDKMVFRLGRHYDLNRHGMEKHTILSPFKNKASLYDWLEVEASYSEHWQELAVEAMNLLGKKLA